MPDAVMLFAAGFGTRMGALTRDRPKPLIPVGGQALIDHALGHVQEFNPRVAVVNAHYKAEQIEDHLRDSQFRVSVEHPDILETGGGLKAALPLLQADTVFTMNTDTIWKGPNPLNVLASAWRDDMQALLLCVPKENTVGHKGAGDFDVDSSGKAVWGSSTIYAGAQIIRTGLVSNKPERVFSLKDVWIDLEAKGALNAVVYDGTWCDVGHPEGLALAEDMLADANV